MKNISNWRSVRVWEGHIERQLRQRHSLSLHGVCIGFFTLGLMWLIAHLQMMMGLESLALRYLITLGTGYLAYLGVLRLWAASLLRRGAPGNDEDFVSGAADLVDVAAALPGHHFGVVEGVEIQAGRGGDFGGGGASGHFNEVVDPPGSGLGDAAGGALDALGSVDEGTVVAIPVIAIFLIGAAVFFSAGSLLLLFFGWDVLLTVAVELAFSYVSARVAVRVVREGWMSAAVRLTWKPLLGAIVCAVILGAAIDHFIPDAHSLPQALGLIGTHSSTK